MSGNSEKMELAGIAVCEEKGKIETLIDIRLDFDILKERRCLR